MVRVAAIDCGTNTIRLLIAEGNPESGITHELAREMRVVRLGEGVDKTGVFAPQALARTFTATREFASIINVHQVDFVRFVATSASRDAKNRDEYRQGIKKILGVEPTVISGDREAELAFQGVISGLKEFAAPVMVVDIGGGSTEFVLGDGRGVKAAISTDMGSVRLYERYLKEAVAPYCGRFADEVPLVAQAVNAAKDEVDKWIRRTEEVVDFSQVRTLVGVAGTTTSLTAHALGLTKYDSAKINGAALPVEELLNTCEWMMEHTVQERQASGIMGPGRADVIGAGALIWGRIIQTVVLRTGKTETLQVVTTSEHDILDGIALDMLAV